MGSKKIIFFVGLGIFILMGLFPPWSFRVQGESAFEQHIGYSFILSPPKEYTYGTYINIELLLVQWIFLGIIVGGIAYFSEDILKVLSRREKESINTPSKRDSEYFENQKKEAWVATNNNRHSVSSQPQPQPSSLSTRWLTFYTYVFLSFSVFWTFVPTFAEIDRLSERGIESQINPTLFTLLLCEATFKCFTIYGLIQRKYWGWVCNWILLGMGVVFSPASFNKEFGSYIVTVGLLLGVWFLPNFFYFKKRRCLFN